MASSGARILVVEDDPAVRRGIVDALRCGGYEPVERDEGFAGLEAAVSLDLDLVLLDMLLPGLDGIQVLEELRRARPRLPVIVVTARGAEPDRVQGLRTGADDYVVKPFSALELLARVEAVLRRTAERPGDVTTLRLDDRLVQLERCQVQDGAGATRLLSPRELEILRYLAANRGRAVSREELLRALWGLNPRGLETRAVDMHVARLRDKLGDQRGQPGFIVTVRARGYMLAEAVETS